MTARLAPCGFRHPLWLEPAGRRDLSHRYWRLDADADTELSPHTGQTRVRTVLSKGSVLRHDQTDRTVIGPPWQQRRLAWERFFVVEGPRRGDCVEFESEPGELPDCLVPFAGWADASHD